MTGSIATGPDAGARRRPSRAARAAGGRRRDARPRFVGRGHRRRRDRRAPGRCSTPRRAGCGPRSSSRTTSRPARRRARRGSSTAACATWSSSASGSSARRWPSVRGCSSSPRISSGSSRCCSRSTASRTRRRRSTTPASPCTTSSAPGTTAAGTAASRSRPRSSWHRPSAATASAAGCSITTGSRTTPATRWPWPGPRWPPARWRSPGSGRPAFARTGRAPSRRSRPRTSTTGDAFEIPTRAVVDATGVWAAEPDHPFRGGSLRILPSRGAHLVVPRERIPNQVGLTIRVPGKIVFLVPWPDHWLIGTTDAPFEGPAARPSAAGWEVDRLLDTVNATMDVDLTRDDVVGTYAGLRPLDRAVRRLDRQGLARAPGDRRGERRRPDRRRQVHDLPGHGPRRHRRASSVARPRRRARATPPSGGSSARPTPMPWPGSPPSWRRSRPIRELGPEAADRLVARHGTEAPAVVALGAELRPAPPARRRAARSSRPRSLWAARHELALSLDDVLARRTRLAQELPDRGAAIAPRVAQILAADLDWGEARRSPRGRDLPRLGAPRVLGGARRRGRSARRRGDDRRLTELAVCGAGHAPVALERRQKSGIGKRVSEARTIPPVNATEGSVARYVARHDSDSSHG